MFRDDCTGNVLDAERFLLHVLLQTLQCFVKNLYNILCRIFSTLHLMHAFGKKEKWH